MSEKRRNRSPKPADNTEVAATETAVNETVDTSTATTVTTSSDDESEYQAQLAADAAEEKEAAEKKRIAEMNGAGAAIAALVTPDVPKTQLPPLPDVIVIADTVVTDNAGMTDEEYIADLAKSHQAALAAQADADKITAEAKAAADALAALAVPPAGACEFYGSHDPNSRACKSCPVKDSHCVAFTASKKVTPAAKVKGSSTTVKTARPPRTGNVSPFSQSDLALQNGKIDSALATPHTMAELMTLTGCNEARIKSHISWLGSNRSATCKKVVADGKIHFIHIAPAVTPVA